MEMLIGWIDSPANWISLLTLTFLEVVLGIDNLLFVSIAVGKLQGKQRTTANRVGIWGAMVLRVLMLGGIFWIVSLGQNALFTLPTFYGDAVGHGDAHAIKEAIEVTIKDLILIGGGLFLLYKATDEIHASVEGTGHEETEAKSNFNAVLMQLIVINIVFSMDSVITAVGMTDIIAIMILAVVFSTLVMAVAAAPLTNFVEKHPTIKTLALAFILLVGVALVADGLGFHIPRGFLYFSLAFSIGVELINIAQRKNAQEIEY
ncbi:MAG: TerC family membrane protein [Hyphomonadaceae bacterium]|nr:MAG: TerC family membrane protein [Hyphomonadaceae bacterium]KAF0183497.1 MAG: TerC family membrane protein [Hyphomonadaceae bacterium]